MSNYTATTNEILNIPIGVIAKYNPEQLHQLLILSVQELERVKRTKEWIEGALAIKYEEQVSAKRLRLERGTGVVHLNDEGFRLTSEVTKKVEWDQRQLQKIIANLASNGANLDDFVETIYHVPESKFNEWSSALQSVFSIARTIKPGRARYKLTKLGGGL